MNISLRTKLILSFVVVVLLTGAIAAWVGFRLIGDVVVRQAQDKVRNDLNTARALYRNKLDRIRDVVELTSIRYYVREGLAAGNIRALGRELQKTLSMESLDILGATDARGIVLYRARNPGVAGDSQSEDELVRRVLLTGQAAAGTTLIPEEELRKEGTDLAEKARIRVIPTPMAKPRPGGEETRGMMLKAVAPVLDEQGLLLGTIYGGVLLNRNYELVDTIKQTVYQGELYKGKEIGSATIFLGDIRISTNVLREDGSRAIGTQVSSAVHDRVLVQGLPWIERAFVVNHWYITAYEPIRSHAGTIIGMLYVGMLEQKFADLRRATLLTFGGITLAGVVGALLISIVLANGILKPLRRLAEATQQLAQGDLSHKVHVNSRDEIGTLGHMFNFMAASLLDRDEQLKQRAQQTIMQSERLATVGQLAAGVAHELNNPLGGILLYANLLLEKAKDGDPIKEDLQVIVRETERCRRIVRGLLDFSRQTKLEMTLTDLNRIINTTLDLVVTQAIFKGITVTRNLSPLLPKVMVDVGQMQQVFINIIMNAAEAMAGNGSLEVTTSVQDNSYVVTSIRDTGPGIPEEIRSKIFDPFFTTKPLGKGTGLGLSIAFGIVRKHNGVIEVETEVGKGTTFHIKLPVMDTADERPRR
ncbi:MAG: cache domain-containing protein [candidate division KSB1 bacterium]|nr:cache domain-containing protein [candidate division KSB1 bacterium]MDZ7296073.1 cache domain-containing protein [candidate division KSB1 bacterium]